MIAANFDITIDRATDWSIVLTIKDAYGTAINLNATYGGSSVKYIFAGEIRNKLTKKEVAVFDLTKLAGTTGVLTIGLTKAKSSLLREADTYEYDIFLVDQEPVTDTYTRLLEGDCFVQNNITR